jgi:hypothetical protein
VLSLRTAGIVAIGVTAARGNDGILVCERGIEFTGGRTVKSFDWITTSLESRTE